MLLIKSASRSWLMNVYVNSEHVACGKVVIWFRVLWFARVFIIHILLCFIGLQNNRYLLQKNLKSITHTYPQNTQAEQTTQSPTHRTCACFSNQHQHMKNLYMQACISFLSQIKAYQDHSFVDKGGLYSG